jgi:hypothetical protein
MEYVLLKGRIKAQTEKAVLLEVYIDLCVLLRNEEHWFPLAYIYQFREDGLDCLEVPGWIYAKKTEMTTRQCNRFISCQLAAIAENPEDNLWELQHWMLETKRYLAVINKIYESQYPKQ